MNFYLSGMQMSDIKMVIWYLAHHLNKYKYKYTFYSLTLKSGPSWGPFGPRQGP